MYFPSDNMKAASRSLVADTLCKLYALGLIVLGIIFPTSRILATDTKTSVLTDAVYDVFHIFLSAVGILFFLFMLTFLVRRVSHFDESELQDSDGQEGIELRGMSRAESTATLNTLQIATVDNLAIDRSYTKEFGNTLRVPDGRNLQQDFSSRGGRSLSVSALDIPAITYGDSRHRRADSVVTILTEAQSLPPEGPVAPATILRHGEASYPNFYVRVGAVLFGVGSLVTWGIAITSVVEVVLMCSLPVPRLDLTKWVLQAVFAALQLHFIFKYSKISINGYEVVCRFGIMHLLAANLNIWIQVVIAELSHDSAVMMGKENMTFGEKLIGLEVSSPALKTCIANIPGIAMIATAAHYVFPLIIEFSLIGAVSFYNIYENIGLMQRIRQRRRRSRAKSSVSSTVMHFPHHQAVNVTCHKSYKGAFVGVIMAAITVISCVIYNIHETSGSTRISGAVFNFTEIALVALAVTAVCHALCKIRSLSILPTYKKGPDETLLMIAAVGVYTFEFYAVFSYINAGPQLDVWMKTAGALSGCLALLQATLQVMFVYDGLRRQTATTKNLRRKPGREAVVFLLLLNLALWMLYSFEIDGGLYQVMSSINPEKTNEWMLMTKLCKPLAIFFRFHSTTCLYEIWKNSYKLKKSTGD